MTRSTTPPLLAELQNAPSAATRAHVLRLIKNELIGHDLRKRSWIASGLIPSLTSILSASRRTWRKNSSRDSSCRARARGSGSYGIDDEPSLIQAVVIIGVLAQGGLVFVHPILHGNVLPPLLALLSSDISSQRLTVSILQTLITIADRLPPANANFWPQDQQLANLLYSKEHIGGLVKIIGNRSAAPSVQQPALLAVSLVVKTCSTNKQKAALTDAGILDALATELSSFVVSQGFVLPGAESRLHETGSLGTLPPAALPRARLAPLLQLAAIITEDSRTRADILLSSPAMVTVFPKPQTEFSPSDVKKTPWGSATYLSGTAVPRHTPFNPIDSLLPSVSTSSAQTTADHAHFPPLSPIGYISKKRNSFLSASISLRMADSEDASHEEDEHPAIAWLIYLVRHETGMTRLMAAKLLVSLFRQGLVRKSRTVMFSMLLIPLLVGMLGKDYEADVQPDKAQFDVLPAKLLVKEEAPAVLGLLLTDSRSLQKAAVDSDAIKKLAQLLKESFDPKTAHRQASWHPDKSMRFPRGRSDKNLGEAGPSPVARHRMRHREGVLKALASLAAFDDEYRKSMCDLGVVPYVIESLQPYVWNPPEGSPGGVETITGNPPATLLAACAAARALTRSVSVLRTSLIDAGVAPPLFHLLHDSDSEVQIAATKVVCNLAMDFSPMKEAIISHNITRTLCQHAHSANPMLRLDSVWALKHLVYNSSNDVKFHVIQELKPLWIKHLMTTNPEDIPPGTTAGIGITHDFGDDVIPRIEAGSVDTVMAENPALQTWIRDTEEKRAQAVSDSDDYSKRAVEDNTKIQAHLLDLVGNLICGDGADEVVEYLFKEFGQEYFFFILAKRLRARGGSRPAAADVDTKEASQALSLPPTDIVIAVIAITLHICAALPRYRTLVIGQTELMKLVLDTLSHPSREVRRKAIWIPINLTYHDDSQEKPECRRRAKELERLGFLSKVMALKDDVDVDVKERTKTALSLFTDLLHG